MDVFNLNTDDYSKSDIEKLLGLKEKHVKIFTLKRICHYCQVTK